MKWIIGLAVVVAMAVAGVSYVTTSKVAIPPLPKLGAPLAGNATPTTTPGAFHNTTAQPGYGSSPSASSGVGGSGTSGSGGAVGGGGPSSGGAAPSGSTGVAAAPAPPVTQPPPVAPVPVPVVAPPTTVPAPTCTLTYESSTGGTATYAVATNQPNSTFDYATIGEYPGAEGSGGSGHTDAAGNATLTVGPGDSGALGGTVVVSVGWSYNPTTQVINAACSATFTLS